MRQQKGSGLDYETMLEHEFDCIIFAGPTLADLKQMIDYQTLQSNLQCNWPVKWLPPVKRGDIEKLVTSYPVGKLAIVDGIFHQSPSVGHAELREALKLGWQIWGLSSMGAIRAYEMRDLGMRGFGRVYQYFLDEEDFRDDEVALIHEAPPNYRACSEPLVHMRVFINELCTRSLLQESEAKQIIDELTELWFGERTLPRLYHQIRSIVDIERANIIKEQLASFEQYRIKSHDLRDFLEQRIWDNDPNLDH